MAAARVPAPAIPARTPRSAGIHWKDQTMTALPDSARFAPPAEPSLAMGIIGNCAFSALIDARARIVWCCLPRFDGDPVFNALLQPGTAKDASPAGRSEEHTSELQSRPHLVCRLLLEKKKKLQNNTLRKQKNKKTQHKKL